MKPESMHSGQPALKWLFRRARTARLWIALSVGLGFGSGLLLIAQAALIAHLIHAIFIFVVSCDFQPMLKDFDISNLIIKKISYSGKNEN